MGKLLQLRQGTLLAGTDGKRQAELVAAAPNNPVYLQLAYGWALEDTTSVVKLVADPVRHGADTLMMLADPAGAVFGVGLVLDPFPSHGADRLGGGQRLGDEGEGAP